MEKKNKILNIIFYSSFGIVTILFTFLTIYSKKYIENDYSAKHYFLISIIFLIILIIIDVSLIIYNVINYIKKLNIQKHNKETIKNITHEKAKNIDKDNKYFSKSKNNNLLIKQILFYLSLVTLIILGILCIIFGFLITIMPIPQILFILNIILTTTLNKNIQNQKLINEIKETKINFNSKEN